MCFSHSVADSWKQDLPSCLEGFLALPGTTGKSNRSFGCKLLLKMGCCGQPCTDLSLCLPKAFPGQAFAHMPQPSFVILRREKISVFCWASHPEQTLQCETGMGTVLGIQISLGSSWACWEGQQHCRRLFAGLPYQAILKLKREDVWSCDLRSKLEFRKLVLSLVSGGHGQIS